MPTPSASDLSNVQVDPALVARFRADLIRVLGRPLTGDDLIAMAVSGGADSFAMLALAVTAFPKQVIAATVDHRLRPESAAEAIVVAEWCDTHEVPHSILTVDPSGYEGSNLQAWARQERYSQLRHWTVQSGAIALCTAHHADDQAETFLMRAARGSGLSGLAAVRARIDDQVLVSNGPGWSASPDETTIFDFQAHPLQLLRPLLNWRSDELRAVAATASLPIQHDPSNADDRFERVRVRRLLANADWLDAVKVSRSAQALAETDADLFALSRWLWDERLRNDDPYEKVIDVADLPRELRRRLARIAIESVRTVNGIFEPAWTFASDIEPLLDALQAGRAATQGGVLARPRRNLWCFSEAPPRRTGT